MSILDTLFGRAPQAQTAPPQNPQNQPFNPNGAPAPQSPTVPVTQIGGLQNQNQPTPGSQTNTLVPNSSNTPVQLDPATGQPLAADPPMSKFKDFFSITPSTDAAKPPSFNLNPETFQAQLAQMDFASEAFTPELSAQILKGGDEAIKAMMTIMNQVGRNSFAKAAQFTTKATEFGFNESKKSIHADLPSQLRKQATVSSLYEAHPNLRNPAVQPLVESATANLVEKYPNATENEIQSLLVEYFDGVGSLFTREPTQQSQREKAKAASTDFSSFLN